MNASPLIPIVIPLHPAGGKFLDNTELRFALRSLVAHFTDPFRLVIVGSKLPPWIVGVEHIVSGGLKSSLKAAAAAFPDGFFWFYDDCCLLRDTTAAVMRLTPACKGWRPSPKTSWGKMLDTIRTRLMAQGLPAVDYSRPHGPYWFDKIMVDEGFEDWHGMKGKFPWESWILSKRRWPFRCGVVKQYYGDFNKPPSPEAWFLNYNDKGHTQELRLWLRARFPVPCRFESDADSSAASNALCGRKAISFSLFGNEKRYTFGAKWNARLAQGIYPEWDCVFHVERDHGMIPELRSFGVRVIEHDPLPGLRGTFWRFLTIGMPEYSHVVCRDLDCRLNLKEREAVDEWLRSGKTLHTMWDYNRKRKRPISAGMFGMKHYPDMPELMAKWETNGLYGDDENFLQQTIWPRFSDDSINHSCRPKSGEIRFPKVTGFSGHVGQMVAPPAHPEVSVRTIRIGRRRNDREIVIAPVSGVGYVAGTALAQMGAALRVIRDGVYPALVLEDDAEWYSENSCEVLPGFSDHWLWVGLSRYSLDGNKGALNHLPRSVSGSTVDMGTMCATHGVLYLSEEGALRMIEGARRALVDKVPIDVGVIRQCIDQNWSRKALAVPWVYQAGKHRRVTRFEYASGVGVSVNESSGKDENADADEAENE